MKKIILVAGRGRHGKDSFADYCLKRIDADKFEMSTDLWQDVCNMFKTSKHLVMANKDKPAVKVFAMEFTFRHFAQFIGNEIVPRLFGKYAWCSIVQNKILESDKKIIFITGVRLLKEEHFFRTINPDIEIIKIERLNEDGSLYCGLMEQDNEHSTEKEVDLITYDEVFTHVPLEELEQNASKFCEKLIKNEEWI